MTKLRTVPLLPVQARGDNLRSLSVNIAVQKRSQGTHHQTGNHLHSFKQMFWWWNKQAHSAMFDLHHLRKALTLSTKRLKVIPPWLWQTIILRHVAREAEGRGGHGWWVNARWDYHIASTSWPKQKKDSSVANGHDPKGFWIRSHWEKRGFVNWNRENAAQTPKRGL